MTVCADRFQGSAPKNAFFGENKKARKLNGYRTFLLGLSDKT